MQFAATWYKAEEVISREKVANFNAARDIARCRLAAHRVRSGATHADVRSDEGILFFDTREGSPKGASNGPRLLGSNFTRFSGPRS